MKITSNGSVYISGVKADSTGNVLESSLAARYEELMYGKKHWGYWAEKFEEELNYLVKIFQATQSQLNKLCTKEQWMLSPQGEETIEVEINGLHYYTYG